MDTHEKHAYLEAMRKRYQRAKRADKGKVLDEFCPVFDYQLKCAIRLLRRKVMPGKATSAPLSSSWSLPSKPVAASTRCPP